MNCKLTNIEIMKIRSEIIVGYPFSNMSIIVWEYELVRSCTSHARTIFTELRYAYNYTIGQRNNLVVFYI